MLNPLFMLKEWTPTFDPQGFLWGLPLWSLILWGNLSCSAVEPVGISGVAPPLELEPTTRFYFNDPEQPAEPEDVGIAFALSQGILEPSQIIDYVDRSLPEHFAVTEDDFPEDPEQLLLLANLDQDGFNATPVDAVILFAITEENATDPAAVTTVCNDLLPFSNCPTLEEVDLPFPTPTPLESPTPAPTSPPGQPAAISTEVIKFRPSDDEMTIASQGGPSLTLDTQTLYIGTWQQSNNNQDPILASFDPVNPERNWVIPPNGDEIGYESTGADGRGQGLFWDGSNLYAVFTVDGTQGDPSEDFRRAAQEATQAWLRSYGQGGGAKISVLAQIDRTTGAMIRAAHISALLSNGNSNTLTIKDLFLNEAENLIVRADSFFSPRNPDGSRMTPPDVEGISSPHDYTLEITRDLRTALSTAAESCVEEVCYPWIGN